MTGNYIIIEEVKGIKRLEFEVPNPGVHVLTATNGCGKTTLLVCLERLKNTGTFKQHFIPNLSRNVDTYEFSKITYISNKNNKVTYTYRKKTKAWRPTTQTSRTLDEFEYTEIISMMPLGKRVYIQDEKIKGGGKSKYASKVFREKIAEILENDKFLYLQKIYIGETRGRRGADRRNNTAFLISYTKKVDGQEKVYFYSELSFSLGEIYTLNLLYQLKEIKDKSLLIIDELEVALHPRVQVNLLRYLQEISLEKELTIIISTHSSSLIKSASNLIYLSSDKHGVVSVNYNCYPALALKEVAVEEDFQPDFVFFVEDSYSQILLREMIVKYFQVSDRHQPLWKILPIGGYSEVIRFTKNAHQYLLNKSIGQFAILDNDVLDSLQELSKKGNKRTEDENELFKIFKTQEHKIKYFDITPEKGVWNWLIDDVEIAKAALNKHFPDSNIDLRKIIK